MQKELKVTRIEFRHSRIYDVQWSRPKEFIKPPLEKDWRIREKKLCALWTKHSGPILRLMSKVTGLNWQEERIIAYLTWGVRPFSDPLTLSLRADVQSVFETLTHELIHRISSEGKNWRIIQKSWKLFVGRYPQEEPIAIHHVPIHAVHELLWGKLFPGRLQAIRQDLKLKAYVRSWELVEQIGAKEVVRKVFHK